VAERGEATRKLIERERDDATGSEGFTGTFRRAARHEVAHVPLDRPLSSPRVVAPDLHDFGDVSHRILVADDDLSAREGLRILLAAWGYEVETAPNGRAALDRASMIRPDAVIADLRMPTMDGLQLLRALHHAEPNLPVIVLTGHSHTESFHRAAEQAAYAYLRKPVDAVKLKSVLVSALAEG